METDTQTEQPRMKREISEETRRRMSEARKGVPKSAAHRANIGKGNKGKKRSPEFCQKMSEQKKAYWEKRLNDGRTEEHSG
jgi:hypothetical protein